jgi:hypothetical protein
MIGEMSAIGPKMTWARAPHMSAFGARETWPFAEFRFRGRYWDQKVTWVGSRPLSVW